MATPCSPRAMQLAAELRKWTNSLTATRIGTRFRIDPADELGELFIQLFRRLDSANSSQDLALLVKGLAPYYLRNAARTQVKRRLRQPINHHDEE